MEAMICDIKKFAVHDGDGIRTTVFFKGCSLKCVWCHNPESISFKPQLSYIPQKCIGCGECAKVCDVHTFKDGMHIFDRNLCTVKGNCVTNCYGEALKIYGTKVTSDELVEEIVKDKAFYDNSGGGATLSGGECLCQADFCRELLMKLKQKGINTAVDTCGNVKREEFDKVIPYTDIFLYDLKAIDPDVHKKCTGSTNELILDNLKYLDEKDCKIEIRIPYVPGYNDGEIEKMGEFLKGFKNITKIKVLHYHNFAGSKYSAVNMPNTLPETLPTDEEVKKAVAILKSFSLNAIDGNDA